MILPRHRLTLVFLVAAHSVLGGCTGGPKSTEAMIATPTTLQVTHHVGGTHYRTIVAGPVWYQTFGVSLLVLDGATGQLAGAIDFGAIGETAPATDMLLDNDRLYVVLHDEAVIELTLADPWNPQITSRVTADQLGIAPRLLSRAAGDLYVSGAGGVVRWSVGRLMLVDQGIVSRVGHATVGLVACIDRRVYRLDDGRYVGSASDVSPLGDEFGMPGTLIFTRRGKSGSLVGLMSANVREIDSQRATVAMGGAVRSVRAFSGRLWIVGDDHIASYKVTDDALADPMRITVLGARDVDRIDDNYLAVAGSFGRAVYRISDDDHGPGDEFVFSHREPSCLTQAQSDGLRVMGLGREGAWLYQIAGQADYVSEPPSELPAPRTSVTTDLASASISQDGTSIDIRARGVPSTFTEPGDVQLHCLAAVDGDIWVGHDRGITVLRPDTSGAAAIRGRLRLEGPVRYIFPRLVGGAAVYVSEYGGFGVAEFVPEPPKPSR
ncbi:MAG: hypothetical protein V3T53_10175 [Phycisphaerales bacterium]